MSIKQAIEEPSDAATKLAELILSDCGHSTAITTQLRDRVALRIDKYTDALAVRVAELEFALADLLGQIEQGHMAVGMEKSPSVQSSCDNALAALTTPESKP